MIQLLSDLKDQWQEKLSKGQRRHPMWSKCRNEFLEQNPYCECGDKAQTVHHKYPVSRYPWLELIPLYFRASCNDCHLWFWHLRWWRLYNVNGSEDIRSYYGKRNQAIQDQIS